MKRFLFSKFRKLQETEEKQKDNMFQCQSETFHKNNIYEIVQRLNLNIIFNVSFFFFFF